MFYSSRRLHGPLEPAQPDVLIHFEEHRRVCMPHNLSNSLDVCPALDGICGESMPQVVRPYLPLYPGTFQSMTPSNADSVYRSAPPVDDVFDAAVCLPPLRQLADDI